MCRVCQNSGANTKVFIVVVNVPVGNNAKVWVGVVGVIVIFEGKFTSTRSIVMWDVGLMMQIVHVIRLGVFLIYCCQSADGVVVRAA